MVTTSVYGYSTRFLVAASYRIVAAFALIASLSSCTTLYFSYRKPMSTGSKATFVNYPAMQGIGDPIVVPTTPEQQAKYISGMSLPGKPEEYRMIYVPPGGFAVGYAIMALNCDPDDPRPTRLNRDHSYQTNIGSTRMQTTMEVDAPCAGVPADCAEGEGKDNSVAIVLHESYGCDVSELTTLDLLYVVPMILHAGSDNISCINNASDSALFSAALSKSVRFVDKRVSDARQRGDTRQTKYLEYIKILTKVKSDNKETNQWWEPENFAIERPMHIGIIADDEEYARKTFICNNLVYLGGLSRSNSRFMQYYLYCMNAWARSAVAFYNRNRREGRAAILEVSTKILRVAHSYPIKLSQYDVNLSDVGELLAIFDEIQERYAQQSSKIEFSGYDDMINSVLTAPDRINSSYQYLLETLLASMYYRDYRNEIAGLIPEGRRRQADPMYEVYADFADKFVTYADRLLTKKINREVDRRKKEQAEEEEKKANLEIGTTVYFEMQLNSKHSSGMVTIEGVKIRSYGTKSEIRVVSGLPKYDGYGDLIYMYGKEPLKPGQTFILAPHQFRLSLF